MVARGSRALHEESQEGEAEDRESRGHRGESAAQCRRLGGAHVFTRDQSWL